MDIQTPLKLFITLAVIYIVHCDKHQFHNLQKTIEELSRQLMLQQEFVEERIRSDGDSGLKQVRVRRGGTRPYFSESHVNFNTIASIHDHANHVRTVGLGEFAAVLNGVDFRTRHNDYMLRMPSRTSKKFGATEDIPFPDVPPAVSTKNTVAEQVDEMRLWFKAWRDQNDKERNYKKYFKPILCYLEGAWTETSNRVDESFPSDRHFLNALTWHELQEKQRFTEYSGTKDHLENFAFLPRAVMNVTEDGMPVFGQWNYRILCNPLKKDLPLNRLRLIDDLVPRMTARWTLERFERSRAARFQINPYDIDKWSDSRTDTEYLDELMGEIPGMDNYPGDLTDNVFGLTAFPVDGPKDKPLNTAYYHRFYTTGKPDAMGVGTRRRAFSDANVFFAQNSQDKIVGMSVNDCKSIRGKRNCKQYTQKWSYAIPLEIIYLTPLNKWNPFNLEYKGMAFTNQGKTVTSEGRIGGHGPLKAFNGTNSVKYFITPRSFFENAEVNPDAADTVPSDAVGVLDPEGDVKLVRASGTRTFLPEISGVGILRQRFPIMPLHGEGSSIWKEFEALKDLLLKPKSYKKVFYDEWNPMVQDGNTNYQKSSKVFNLENIVRALDMQTTMSNAKDPHKHDVHLAEHEVLKLAKGHRVTVRTEQAAGHTHELQLKYHRASANKAQWLEIFECDGKLKCGDGHKNYLTL